MNNIDIAHKIAWSFHHTTGLEFEDLQSVAYLALVEAEKTYQGNTGVRFSTYAYHHIRNALVDYCTKEQTRAMPVDPHPDQLTTSRTPEQDVSFMSVLEGLSDEAKTVCKIIFESPNEFLELNRPKLSRGRVKEKLRELGWSWSMIWDSFREIKTALRE